MGLTNVTSFTRVQQMQYYPSGLPWNDNYKASQQPYKYGSKEFVEMHGLDEYDSEARWYYPALMRTTTQDPLAEKYYDISPYAWCANNPVNLVDPDGRRIKIVDGEEEEEYVLNSQYTGENEYIDLMYSALNKIYSIEMGKTVLDPLISSDDVYTILNKKSLKEETQSYTAETKTMNITPKENTDDKLMYAINAIAHESFHAYQLYKGSSVNTIHSEVEAYLYAYALSFNKNKPIQNLLYSSFLVNDFNFVVDQVLYSKDFNKNYFNQIVKEFKCKSSLMIYGVYDNLELSSPHQKYLLIQFYPLIP
jgi:RHS repeat-associated protein